MTALTFGSAVATVVGGWILGACINPDFARFARNTKHAVGYALAHYTFNYPLLLVICGIMAMGFGAQDLMSHLVPSNLGWILLLLIIFATWAANDCNLYSSSLGLTAVLPAVKRSRLAIIAGILGVLMAEFHVSEHMVSFLVLLGILIAPIGGVFVVGAIDARDPVHPEQLAPVPHWRIAPICSWLGGAALGLIVTPKTALGLGFFNLTTIPALDALLCAGAIMFVVKACEKSSARTVDVSNTAVG